MSASLVGSEMCIRDRARCYAPVDRAANARLPNQIRVRAEFRRCQSTNNRPPKRLSTAFASQGAAPGSFRRISAKSECWTAPKGAGKCRKHPKRLPAGCRGRFGHFSALSTAFSCLI
eukprot:15478788-Alexandrium_andersonii.AAC.1